MKIRLSANQRAALVASVTDYDDRTQGVILRGSKRRDGDRALTEVGLMRLRQLGLVGEWRTLTGGSEVTSVRLNEDGIRQAIALRDDPTRAWIEATPSYA